MSLTKQNDKERAKRWGGGKPHQKRLRASLKKKNEGRAYQLNPAVIKQIETQEKKIRGIGPDSSGLRNSG